MKPQEDISYLLKFIEKVRTFCPLRKMRGEEDKAFLRSVPLSFLHVCQLYTPLCRHMLGLAIDIVIDALIANIL